MDKRKGRPKGEQKTMISARITNINMKRLKQLEVVYGQKKSILINAAIKILFNNWNTNYVQKEIEETN